MAQHKPSVVVGIAGGSGSGKSTLVSLLRESKLGDEICVLEHDHYYRNASEMPETIRLSNNWDHPAAIDNELFVGHLDQLRQGKTVNRPVYSFVTHQRQSETQVIEPRRIIIVEGILIFAVPEICERLDWRLYLEATADERILRRILRDTRERGRSLESVVSQYRTTTRPMHEEWIEPSRSHSHLIVPSENPSSIQRAAELLIGFFSSP